MPLTIQNVGIGKTVVLAEQALAPAAGSRDGFILKSLRFSELGSRERLAYLGLVDHNRDDRDFRGCALMPIRGLVRSVSSAASGPGNLTAEELASAIGADVSIAERLASRGGSRAREWLRAHRARTTSPRGDDPVPLAGFIRAAHRRRAARARVGDISSSAYAPSMSGVLLALGQLNQCCSTRTVAKRAGISR